MTFVFILKLLFVLTDILSEMDARVIDCIRNSEYIDDLSVLFTVCTSISDSLLDTIATRVLLDALIVMSGTD